MAAPVAIWVVRVIAVGVIAWALWMGSGDDNEPKQQTP